MSSSQDVDHDQKRRRPRGFLCLRVQHRCTPLRWISVAGILVLIASFKDFSLVNESNEDVQQSIDSTSTKNLVQSNPTEKIKKWDALISRVSPLAHRMKATTVENLKAGMNSTCTGDYKKPEPCRYKDVVSFVPLKAPDVLSGSFVAWEETKAMINPSLYLEGESCIVYGIGISTDSTFEQSMTPFCEVHAFDCTVKRGQRSVRNKNFTFHPTCIGPSTHDTGLRNTMYGKALADKTWHFQTLMETMEKLKHDRVDYLKFDTEGAEWNGIFDTIFVLPRARLPRQIMFEIHAEGANPTYVPPVAVQGKNRPQINQIILDLINVGYGILDVKVNPDDSACAEISMLLLDDIESNTLAHADPN